MLICSANPDCLHNHPFLTMKNETLLLKRNPATNNDVGRDKKAVGIALVGVITAYLLFTAAAFWWPSLSLPAALSLFFLGAGVFHTWRLKQHSPSLASKQEWLFTTALAFIVLLLLSASVVWGLPLSFRNRLAGAGAFFLPFVLVELWLIYAAMSYEGAIPWQAKADGGNNFPSIYLNGLPVKFRIISEADKKALGPVSFLASGKIPLGEVFNDMVQKQGKKEGQFLSLLNDEDEPSAWIFYTNDMLIWNRVLNPAKSLRANGVRKNAVIYAQRVTDAAFIHPSPNEQTISQ